MWWSQRCWIGCALAFDCLDELVVFCKPRWCSPLCRHELSDLGFWFWFVPSAIVFPLAAVVCSEGCWFQWGTGVAHVSDQNTAAWTKFHDARFMAQSVWKASCRWGFKSRSGLSRLAKSVACQFSYYLPLHTCQQNTELTVSLQPCASKHGQGRPSVSHRLLEWAAKDWNHGSSCSLHQQQEVQLRTCVMAALGDQLGVEAIVRMDVCQEQEVQLRKRLGLVSWLH